MKFKFYLLFVCVYSELFLFHVLITQQTKSYESYNTYLETVLNKLCSFSN